MNNPNTSLLLDFKMKFIMSLQCRVHAEERGGDGAEESSSDDGQAGSEEQGQRDVGEEPDVHLRGRHQAGL